MESKAPLLFKTSRKPAEKKTSRLRSGLRGRPDGCASLSVTLEGANGTAWRREDRQSGSMKHGPFEGSYSLSNNLEI